MASIPFSPFAAIPSSTLRAIARWYNSASCDPPRWPGLLRRNSGRPGHPTFDPWLKHVAGGIMRLREVEVAGAPQIGERRTRRTGAFGAIVPAVLALLAAACATPQVKKAASVYFPPSPELPRIQYLTSFTGLKDVEEQSAFDKFVVGEKQDVKLDKPYGVAIYDGKIYVCDTNATVIVFDLKGRTFGTLKGAAGPGQLLGPVNISIERDGTKYVADPVRGQVVAFDRDDGYLKAYGEPGAWRPVDAVPFHDRLYVADPSTGLVKVFDIASGELLKAIGDKGEPSERLDRPTNLAFDFEGYLYVTDVGRFQVVKFDRDGHFKATFGRPGDNLGHFARPKGIALDREGRLYAVDASFNNVQVFSEGARLLMFFGGAGDQAGNFLLPAKVAIDYDNLKYFQKYVQPNFEVQYLVLVTSQFGPRLVNVLAYGREKGGRYPSDEELLKLMEQKRQKEMEKTPKE
jgi:DNA-binding beta-propeller fold protein YncE